VHVNVTSHPTAACPFPLAGGLRGQARGATISQRIPWLEETDEGIDPVRLVDG
jgi:hypothetical protein